jgi:uncharacterized MAPEG superfamily protein
MTIAYWCVLFMGLLPYVATGIAKKGFEGYDNGMPRQWLSKQIGFRARANAAQQNYLEAFPFFAVAVILAALGGIDGDTLESLSWLYIAARVAYVACYLTDKAMWRSVAWVVGHGLVIYLYVVSLY